MKISDKTYRRWAMHLHRSCRGRFNKGGIDLEIDADFIETLLRESKWHCSLTGITFTQEKRGPRKKRPFAPSLDRIDSSKGYVPGNVRIVCVAVNYAMSDWGEDVLRRIAVKLVKKEKIPLVRRVVKKLPGVCRRKNPDRFEAVLMVGAKRHYLGVFDTEGEASRHYLAAKDGVKSGLPVESFKHLKTKTLASRFTATLATTNPPSLYSSHS